MAISKEDAVLIKFCTSKKVPLKWRRRLARAIREQNVDVANKIDPIGPETRGRPRTVDDFEVAKAIILLVAAGQQPKKAREMAQVVLGVSKRSVEDVSGRVGLSPKNLRTLPGHPKNRKK